MVIWEVKKCNGARSHRPSSLEKLIRSNRARVLSMEAAKGMSLELLLIAALQVAG